MGNVREIDAKSINERINSIDVLHTALAYVTTLVMLALVVISKITKDSSFLLLEPLAMGMTFGLVIRLDVMTNRLRGFLQAHKDPVEIALARHRPTKLLMPFGDILCLILPLGITIYSSYVVWGYLASDTFYQKLHLLGTILVVASGIAGWVLAALKAKTGFQPLTLAQRITEAELVREAGNIEEAITMLEQIIAEIKTAPLNGSLLASAYGHLILCYKHRYLADGDEDSLVQMEHLIKQGLALNVPEVEKTVFYVRCGDIEMERSEYPAAEKSYGKAYILAPDKHHQKYECAGHLAQAKTKNGKAEEALKLLNDAIAGTCKHRNIRFFHRLIILSGLYARMGEAAAAQNSTNLSYGSFLKGYVLAWLLLFMGKPLRLGQYHKAMRQKIST